MEMKEFINKMLDENQGVINIFDLALKYYNEAQSLKEQK